MQAKGLCKIRQIYKSHINIVKYIGENDYEEKKK